MQSLAGRVAVVSGKPRRGSRDIALALCDAGAVVYVAVRSTRDGAKPGDGAAGTIEDTAEEVTRRGGAGVAVRTDFTRENEVGALFDRIRRTTGGSTTWRTRCGVQRTRGPPARARWHRGVARSERSRRVHGISVVTLMPGFMRTDRVVAYLRTEKQRRAMGFDRSESTEYVGRAVAGLAADGAVLKKSGRIHFVADLAREYGFTDADGRHVGRFRPFS